MADETSIQMLLMWERVLDVVVPEADLAFPNMSGEQVTNLDRKIKCATTGYNLPTATDLRKEVEIQNKRLQGPLREAVSRALSHSQATAQQYYQAPSERDIIQTYDVISNIISGKKGRDVGETNDDRKGKKRIVDEKQTEERGDVKGKGKGKKRVTEEDDVEEQEKKEREVRKGKKRVAFQDSSDEEESEGGEAKEKSWMMQTSRREVKGKGKKRVVMQILGDEEESEGGEAQQESWRAKQTSTRKRKKFSEEDERNIKDYFQMHIANSCYPTMEECRQFLKMYPIPLRSDKDIYDKCRNIVGRR